MKGNMLPVELFDLGRWDGLTAEMRLDAALAVAEGLPRPWKFISVETHELGDQQHHVAFLDWNGAAFSLIPGGKVTLGYDRDDPFVPNARQQASWDWTNREWGHMDLNEYLDSCMTPLRYVVIEPFLLEVQAMEWGATLLDPSPIPGARVVELRRGSYDEVLNAIAADGFRFPTADEWEYACAAGSRSLWRWGNDCPTDEAEEGEWDLIEHPNAFGLLIGMNPFAWEFCAAPAILRGGDGGGAGCGGLGALAYWLTLASAFHQADREERWGRSQPIPGAHLRRAYSLQ